MISRALFAVIFNRSQTSYQNGFNEPQSSAVANFCVSTMGYRVACAYSTLAYPHEISDNGKLFFYIRYEHWLEHCY